MYKCPNDNHELKLTGEEGSNAWFMCPKCNRWYVVDLRDDSIELYKEKYVGIKNIKSEEKLTNLLTDLLLIVQRLEREGVDLCVDDIKVIWKAKTFLGYSNHVSLEEGTGGLIRRNKEHSNENKI